MSALPATIGLFAINGVLILGIIAVEGLKASPLLALVSARCRSMLKSSPSSQVPSQVGSVSRSVLGVGTTS